LKTLHRKDLYCWSKFDIERNIDFNGLLWINPRGGNIIIDPVEMQDYDKKHLEILGGATSIIITNSDHIRDTENILALTGAKCFGPIEEKKKFPFTCDYWLKDGDQPLAGIDIFSFNGSKTNGELAILIEKNTLVTGDLIRCHHGGKLSMLPDEKLRNRRLAIESIKRMASIKEISSVIPCDGWPIFNYGHEALKELCKGI
tara:strand:- start:2270 stop:2872 length:603 start_codon:yes stop_codon:yes gene_type:complete